MVNLLLLSDIYTGHKPQGLYYGKHPLFLPISELSFAVLTAFTHQVEVSRIS